MVYVRREVQGPKQNGELVSGGPWRKIKRDT